MTFCLHRSLSLSLSFVQISIIFLAYAGSRNRTSSCYGRLFSAQTHTHTTVSLNLQSQDIKTPGLSHHSDIHSPCTASINQALASSGVF